MNSPLGPSDFAQNHQKLGTIFTKLKLLLKKENHFQRVPVDFLSSKIEKCPILMVWAKYGKSLGSHECGPKGLSNFPLETFCPEIKDLYFRIFYEKIKKDAL